MNEKPVFHGDVGKVHAQLSQQSFTNTETGIPMRQLGTWEQAPSEKCHALGALSSGRYG